MKELNIEEKARRYEEAIERAKNFIENGDERERTIAESIFAGIMEESEDERIRRALIELVGMVDKNPIGQIFGYGDIKYSDMTAWLENQGKQKQDPCHTCDHPTMSCNDFPCEKKQAEQKPANEPKFHEGEWLVENSPNNYARFIQILEVVNVYGRERYRISRDIHNDEDVVECRFIENNYHFFTIQDAKPGDVLVHNDCTFIFMGIKDGIVQAIEENMLKPVPFGEPDKDNDYHPATKEQRDRLFQKMYEAGYKWDAEKKELKELKKIEQKQIVDIKIPYGAKDNELQEVSYHIPEGFHAKIEDNKVIIKKGGLKPAWRGKDKKMVEILIKIFEINYGLRTKILSPMEV